MLLKVNKVFSILIEIDVTDLTDVLFAMVYNMVFQH